MTTQSSEFWREQGLREHAQFAVKTLGKFPLIHPFDSRYTVITCDSEGAYNTHRSLIFNELSRHTKQRNHFLEVLPDPGGKAEHQWGFYHPDAKATLNVLLAKGRIFSRPQSLLSYQLHMRDCLCKRLTFDMIQQVKLPRTLITVGNVRKTHKAKRLISEWAEWAKVLIQWANPADLGLDRSTVELALPAHNRKKVMGDNLINIYPWDKHQAYEAVKAFKAIGWLESKASPIKEKGIGSAYLGNRLHITPLFLTDLLQIPQDAVDAFFRDQVDRYHSQALEAYFIDRINQMKLHQRQVKARVEHQAYLNDPSYPEIYKPYHQAVIEQLNQTLGSNQGGRPSPLTKQSVELKTMHSEDSPTMINTARAAQNAQPFPETPFYFCDTLATGAIHESLRQTKWFQAARLAESTYKVPFEMAIQSVLGALSIACQRGLKMQLLPDRPALPTSLYLLTVARSSSGKSSLDDPFFQKLRDQEKCWINQQAENEQNLKLQLKKWSIETRALEKRAEKLIEKGENEEEIQKVWDKLTVLDNNKPGTPRPERFIFNDITGAALMDQLQNRWSMGAVVSTEADKLFNILMKDSENLNKFWSSETVTLFRKGQKDNELENVALTLALQTQPNTLKRLSDRQRKAMHGNGFYNRLLMVTPPEKTGPVALIRAENPEAIEVFADHLVDLLEKSLCQPYEQKKVVSFSPEAQAIWEQFKNAMDAAESPDHLLHQLGDFAKKIPEQVARIAALLHHCESDSDQIEAPVLQFAISLMQVYAFNNRKYFQPVPEIVVKAEKALKDLIHLFGKWSKSDKGPEMNAKTHGYVVNINAMYNKDYIDQEGDLEKIIQILIQKGNIQRHQIDGEMRLVFSPEKGKISLEEAYNQVITQAALFSDHARKAEVQAKYAEGFSHLSL